MRDIVVRSCCRGRGVDTPLYQSTTKLGLYAEFREDNSDGLPKVYNEWLDLWCGKDAILVLAHDDLCITDCFIREKLNWGIEGYGYAVMGIVGSAYFNPLTGADHYGWRQWPASQKSGAIEQPTTIPGNGQMEWCVFGPTPRRCVVLDGMFLAIDVAKIAGRCLRFDEQFNFDLYDLDFCLSAHKAGLTIGTIGVHARHYSDGDFLSTGYREGRKAFREKWVNIGVQEVQR